MEVVFPQLCKAFMDTAECRDKSCHYLHLCPDFITGNCNHAKHSVTTSIVHSLLSPHNKKVLKKLNLWSDNELEPLCTAKVILDVAHRNSKFPQINSLDPAKCQAASRRLVICALYVGNECDCVNCEKLHICKNYLAGENLCACNLSHDIFNEHNVPILRHSNININMSDRDEAVAMVKNYFPQLCHSYLTNSCQWGSKCCGIHVCMCILLNSTCMKYCACGLSHSLNDAHNSRIAMLHGYQEDNRGDLESDILFLNSLSKHRPCLDISLFFEATPEDTTANGSSEDIISPSLSPMDETLVLTSNASKSENTPLDGMILDKETYDETFLNIFKFPSASDTTNNANKSENTQNDGIILEKETCDEAFANFSIFPSTDPGVKDHTDCDVGFSPVTTNSASEAVQQKEEDALMDVIDEKTNEVSKSMFDDNNVTISEVDNQNVNAITMANSSIENVSECVEIGNEDMITDGENTENDHTKAEADVCNFIIPSKRTSFKFYSSFDSGDGLNESLMKHLELWIQRSTTPTSIEVTPGKDDLFSRVCVEDLKPCYLYWSRDGCSAPSCKMIHICKEYLYGIQQHTTCTACNFSHDIFECCKDNDVLTKLRPYQLSAENILVLLHNRFPLVCNAYLNSQCIGEELCPNIHVCGNFVNGECNNPICKYAHEAGLDTEHSKKIMDVFHLNQEEFVKCIIYKDGLMQDSNDKCCVKEDGICTSYLNDKCYKDDNRCPFVHPYPKLPYLWQYRQLDGGVWHSFSTMLNSDIEKCFCDPKIEEYRNEWKENGEEQLLYIHFTSTNGIYKGSYQGSLDVGIRRLSTLSLVAAGDKDASIGFTKWLWYQQLENKEWKLYTIWVTSEDIEKAYLEDPSEEYFFAMYNSIYSLNFNRMIEVNEHFEIVSKRRIRRRPAYKTLVNVCDENESELPSHWPKDVEYGQCIPITNEMLTDKIVSEFRLSMKHPVEILSVEEVCNPSSYLKYQRTKRLFVERLGKENINEMTLYHGTPNKSVKAICVQNFDFRVNINNGHLWGKGCYFATKASISHMYTERGDQKMRYMFVAKVLAGQYAQGARHMTRPPAIPVTSDSADGTIRKRTCVEHSHDLYDSCVDNVDLPSIYALFERDQYYPQYLIKYKTDLTMRFPKKLPMGRIIFPSKPDQLAIGVEVDFDDGHGVIRWISEDQTIFGLSLENPFGNSDGTYMDVQRFQCKNNHAAFVTLQQIRIAWII